MLANGTWSAQPISHATDERDIIMLEWWAAARMVENRMHLHLGDERTKMFRKHHLVVEDFAGSHRWELAVEYDISQR